MSKNQNDDIDLEDLRYYFDSQRRDSIDSSRVGRKSGQVLALRNKLLSLPEEEFNVAIRTLEQMVDSAPKNGDSDKTPAEKKADAINLFNKQSQTQ